MFSFEALNLAYLEAQDSYEIEHVTSFFSRRSNRFKIGETKINVSNTLKHLRLTIDCPSDYAMLNIIFTHFEDRIFSLD